MNCFLVLQDVGHGEHCGALPSAAAAVAILAFSAAFNLRAAFTLRAAYNL
jgi:hypothetical protein